MSKFLKKGAFSHPVDPSVVRKNWKERGYSFVVNTDPPGHEWNSFVHASDELLTVVSGQLKLLMNDEELICGPGDEVFIPRDIVHSVHNVNRSETTWIYGYN